MTCRYGRLIVLPSAPLSILHDLVDRSCLTLEEGPLLFPQPHLVLLAKEVEEAALDGLILYPGLHHGVHPGMPTRGTVLMAVLDPVAVLTLLFLSRLAFFTIVSFTTQELG